MRALLPLLLTACVYDAPVEDDADLAPALVSGTVVVTGLAEPAATMILLYDAADPPPPAGTGRPLTFGTVPPSAFRRGGEGLLEADFEVALPGVDEAEVLVTALVDVDGDFNPLPPFAEVLGGATCGDLAGAHVLDLDSGTLEPVTLVRNQRTEGVTVLVARENLFERPAFVMQGGTPVVSREAAGLGATQTFRMASTGIAAVLPDADGEPQPLLDLAAPFDGTDPCGTAFWLTVYDRDGDGQPDEHPDLPGTGLPDAWPRVFLEYLGEVDDDGTVTPTLEPGEAWAGQAALFPDVVWFGEVPLNVPTPVTEVEYVWLPAARHTLPDGSVETVRDPADLPAGAWSVTVINLAGQTWTLPNALSRVGTADAEAFVPASQAGALIVE